MGGEEDASETDEGSFWTVGRPTARANAQQTQKTNRGNIGRLRRVGRWGSQSVSAAGSRTVKFVGLVAPVRSLPARSVGK